MVENAIYTTEILTKRLAFSISEIVASDTPSLKQFIEIIVRDTFEGICVSEGYIKKKSVKLITLSSGLVIKQSIVYDITFSCDIFIPVNGSIITCKVASVTRAGIRAYSNQENPSPFIAFVTKDLVFEDPSFETMQIDDTFVCKIIGTRFEVNDKYVSIIAEFLERKDKTQIIQAKTIRYQKQKKSRIKEEKEDDGTKPQVDKKRHYKRNERLKNEKVLLNHESLLDKKHDQNK